MTDLKIYWIIISAAVILLLLHSMATAAEPGEELLVNGDFSETVEGSPAGSELSAETAQVTVLTQYAIDFKSPHYYNRISTL